MLAYLYEVGVAADLGDRAAEIRALVKDRAPELRGWTAQYVATDADGRARMWRDGTSPGELVLDQAALACYDLVPALLRRTLPYLASERGRRKPCAAAAVGSLARQPSSILRATIKPYPADNARCITPHWKSMRREQFSLSLPDSSTS